MRSEMVKMAKKATLNATPAIVASGLVKRFTMAVAEQYQSDEDESDRNFHAFDVKIARHFPFAVRRTRCSAARQRPAT